MLSINYDEPLFRPPSEANSLILQVTLGCSHNKCLFCEMYKSKKFKVVPFENIEKIVKEISKDWPNPEKIFLADGDAFILSPKKLIKTCELIRKHFKNNPRISTYATPESILNKTDLELKEIKSSGISLLYYGVESGNDFILKKINKGANSKEIALGIKRAQDAGFDVSSTWILGLGGKRYSKEHVGDTAKLFSETGSKYVSALTLMLPAGVKQFNDNFPEWEEMSSSEVLDELKRFVELYDGPEMIFRSNHASNYVHIKALLPADRNKTLEAIKNSRIRPEWSRSL